MHGPFYCHRLSRTINADACIFVGETLSLYCRTVNRIELDIVDVNMLSRGATHSVLSTVDNVNDVNGTFGCLLSQSRVHPYLKGPCGPHALEFNVQVFGKLINFLMFFYVCSSISNCI